MATWHRSEVGEFIVIEVGKIGFLVAEQCGFGVKEIGSRIAHGHEVEVARHHPAEVPPIAEEFGEVAIEEHIAARQFVEGFHAAEIDQRGSHTSVGKQPVGSG